MIRLDVSQQQKSEHTDDIFKIN